MPKGCFIVTLTNDTLSFDKLSTVGDVPQDQIDVLEAVQRTEIHISRLRELDDPAVKSRAKDYLKCLAYAADVGLSHKVEVSTKLSLAAIGWLRDDITSREAFLSKNSYVALLGFITMILVVTLFVLCEPHRTLTKYSEQVTNALWLVLGVQPGVWASFVGRKATYTIDDITVPESDRLHPLARIVYVSILSFFFALVLASGIIKIEIGGFNPATWTSNPGVALTFGFICGLGEFVLASRLSQVVGQVFGGRDAAAGNTK